jgi:DnaJ-class molecular chaperone
MILRCHPDKNNHPDATAAFRIITTAKEEVEERVKQIAADIRDFGTREEWEAEDRAQREQDEFMRESVNMFQKAQAA